MQLIVVTDPILRRERDVKAFEYRGETLDELRLLHMPGLPPEKVIISSNGNVVPQDCWQHYMVSENEQLLFVPLVEDGDVLRTVAMIGIAYAAWYAAPWIASGFAPGTAGVWAGAGFGTKLIAGGLMIAGSMVVNALLPPMMPKLPGDPGVSGGSPWAAQQTMQQQGLPISRAYGKCRLHGNIISSYIESDLDEQHINAVVCLGHGPFKRIYTDNADTSGCKINGQLLNTYQPNTITMETRTGTIDQPPFNDHHFSQTKVEFPVARIVNAYDEGDEEDQTVLFTTNGNAFDAVEVDIAAPQGIWRLDSDGNMAENTVVVEVVAKPTGTNDAWQNITCETVIPLLEPYNYSLEFAGGDPNWILASRPEPNTSYIGIKNDSFTWEYKSTYAGGGYWSLGFWTQGRIDLKNYESVLRYWGLSGNTWQKRPPIPDDIVARFKASGSKVWYEYLGLGANDLNPASHSEGAVSDTWVYGRACRWHWVQSGDFTTAGGHYFKTLGFVGAGDEDQGYDATQFDFWPYALDTFTLTGSLMDSRTKTFTWDLPSPAQQTIRVRKITPDRNSASYGDKVYLSAVREVVKDRFAYPKRAVVAIRAKSTDQLSGSLDVSIMADAQYVRVWNGTAWECTNSDNPAWVAFDMLTRPAIEISQTAYAADPGYEYSTPHPDGSSYLNFRVARYDGRNPAFLDLTAFKAWADWCDELCIDDNEGHYSKRVTFNGEFAEAENLWDSVLSVFMAGRATPVWRGNYLSVIVDRKIPDGIVPQIFGTGNIIMDSLKVTYSSTSERASEITADFRNADKDYDSDQLTVLEPDMASTNAVSVSCKGMVHTPEVARAIKYRLYCNKLLIRTISFTAGIDSIASEMGDVIGVPFYSMISATPTDGRIISASNVNGRCRLKLDRAVSMETGKSYVVIVRYGDDSIHEYAVVTDAQATDEIDLTSTLAPLPQQFDVYAFGEADMAVQLFRITYISRNSDRTAEITAVEYNEDVYLCDTLAVPTTQVVYTPTVVVPRVSGVTASERRTYNEDGTIRIGLDVSWTLPQNHQYARHYEVWSQAGRGQWKREGITSSGANTSYVVDGVLPATTYTVAICTVPVVGNPMSRHNAPTATATTDGLNRGAVPNVVGLEIFGRNGATTFGGKDCKLIWREATAASAHVADASLSVRPSDKRVTSYRVKVYTGKPEADGSLSEANLRREESVKTAGYSYTYEKNCEDDAAFNGAPVREFTVCVWAEDAVGNLSAIPAMLTASNPPPPMVLASDIIIAPQIRGFALRWKRSNDLDFRGYRLWGSTQPGFELADSNLLHDGPNNAANLSAGSGITMYFRVGAYDAFGTSGMSASAEVSATTIIIPSTDLAASQRVDFVVMDSIFRFGWESDPATTISWTAGAILRDNTAYTLNAGSLSMAHGCYIIAALSADTSTAALSSHPLADGVPTLFPDQVIISYTSGTANISGRYTCYVRQANSAMFDGADIRLATIGDAHLHGDIKSLDYNADTHTGWRIDKDGGIEATGIVLYDQNGNVILRSGEAGQPEGVDWAHVFSGSGDRPADGATKNTIYRQADAPASGETDDIWFETDTGAVYHYNNGWVKSADVTANSTAAAIAGQGAFATLNKINSGNASTYIEDLAVGTLQIADNAVTVAAAAFSAEGYRAHQTYPTPGPVQSVVTQDIAGQPVRLAFSCSVSGIFAGYVSLSFCRNGVALRTTYLPFASPSNAAFNFTCTNTPQASAVVTYSVVISSLGTDPALPDVTFHDRDLYVVTVSK